MEVLEEGVEDEELPAGSGGGCIGTCDAFDGNRLMQISRNLAISLRSIATEGI